MEVNERGLVAPIGNVVLCSRPEAALDPLAEGEVLGGHRVHGELHVRRPVLAGLLGGRCLGDVGAAACARSRELMADCNVASRLGEIAVPTLILAGGATSSVHHRRRRGCIAESGARRWWCSSGADIILSIEEADAFRSAVRRWLA